MDLNYSLKIMEKVWGRGRSGYVFLPWIPGDCKDKAERRKSYREGNGFQWPRDRDKILAHMERHVDDDLYWCPSPFEKNRRLEPYAVPELSLWADLDEANPEDIEVIYRPTAAWETSPGRYQAVWLLTREVIGVSWAGHENHKLTAYLGADPSGWDTTQLLRVPGWRNHKPEYRKKYGGPVQGKILWKNGPRYDIHMFDDLPDVQTLSVDESVMDEEIEAVDRHEVWSKIRLKVSKAVRQYMTAREPTGDRSEVLWQIERELADAGCTLSEIVAIVRGTVWNKYRGRNDELKRLRIEAAKALQAKDTKGDDLEELHEAKRDAQLVFGEEWDTEPAPEWLVENIWRAGSCGFISGNPKNYKSWVALDLALSIASGTNFLNYFKVFKPGPVLFIEEEDRQSEVENRIMAILNPRTAEYFPSWSLRREGKNLIAGDPHPLLFYRTFGEGFIASEDDWQAWLIDQVRRTEASFVVIDTLGTTAGDADPDKGSEVMSKILAPLKQVAHHREGECAIAVVHHNKKSSEGLGGHNMLGSHHLHAWTEDALFFGARQGSKVRIRRESKGAADLDFDLMIPTMKHIEQKRALWLPQVECESGQEYDRGATKGDDDSKPETDPRRGSGSNRKRSKGGDRKAPKEKVAPVIIGRMIAAGFMTGELISASHIAERTHQKVNTTYVQLDRASKNGWVEKIKEDGHTFWRLTD